MYFCVSEQLREKWFYAQEYLAEEEGKIVLKESQKKKKLRKLIDKIHKLPNELNINYLFRTEYINCDNCGELLRKTTTAFKYIIPNEVKKEYIEINKEKARLLKPSELSYYIDKEFKTNKKDGHYCIKCFKN